MVKKPMTRRMRTSRPVAPHRITGMRRPDLAELAHLWYCVHRSSRVGWKPMDARKQGGLADDERLERVLAVLHRWHRLSPAEKHAMVEELEAVEHESGEQSHCRPSPFEGA